MIADLLAPIAGEAADVTLTSSNNDIVLGPVSGAQNFTVATGGGTLVHEIVHPFMRANFPECPAWFNEGMGSLYEQCSEVNGRIAGLTNKGELSFVLLRVAEPMRPNQHDRRLGCTDSLFQRANPG